MAAGATGAVLPVGLAALGGAAADAAGTRVFAHGVASGDPLPHAVVLWTRVTPTPSATPGSGKGPRVEVTWQVARDAGFRRIVRQGVFVTGPGRDHTVKVDARGLEAGTRYHYRFLHDGHVSRVGRTCTAPETTSRPRRLRVGVVSCSNYQAGYFSAYRHLARRDDLDAVVHLGDYLYESGPNDEAVRDHVPPHEIVTLADYRRRHAQHKLDPDLADLHARVPFIVTWDDHEVTNDSWRTGAENHDRGEGSYARRRARAHRAYDEWMPVRMDGTAALDDGTRLYRRLRWGRLAEFTMLDLRSYRDRIITTPAPFPLPQLQLEADDPDRTITGDAQMRWLKDSLTRDAAQWKLIGNSVMIAPLSFGQLPTDLGEVVNRVTGEHPSDGVPLNTDQWDGYTADRRELFAHIARHDVRDAVFLTGDIHAAWASDLPLDPGLYPLGGTAGVEFTCTSVTSDNIDDETGAEPRTLTLGIEATLQAANRHMKYINFDDHGYSVLDVTRERAQMDYYVVSDKRQRRTTVRCDASWKTVSGSGRVTRAAGPVT